METIYGWIYRAGQKAGRLWRFLTRSHARRKMRHARASRDMIAEKTHISQRSGDADARETVGHWEADLVICKRSQRHCHIDGVAWAALSSQRTLSFWLIGTRVGLIFRFSAAVPLNLSRDQTFTAVRPSGSPSGVTASVRDIRGHLEEFYGLEVSPDLISRVTDAVLDEVKEWRSRALDAVYPVVIFDALRVKIRDKDSRIVKNKAVYLALGITGEGEREVLGLWIAENEGAKFWLSVMNELRNRGVQDILIAVVDGLKGFPQAINSAFPETTVQTCVVHLVRHSLNFCSWKDRKAIAARLRDVYVAETARDALEAFDEDWGRQYPSIAQAWRRAWEEVIPFFAFGPEMRRVSCGQRVRDRTPWESPVGVTPGGRWYKETCARVDHPIDLPSFYTATRYPWSFYGSERAPARVL